MQRAAWLNPVAKYVEAWKSQSLSSQRPQGATSAELNRMEAKALAANLIVPDDYLTFLGFVNGTSFDGMSFAGAEIPVDDPLRRGDFLKMNSAEFDATDGDATVYGMHQWKTWRFSKSSGKFEQIDEALDVEKSFDSFAKMIFDAFSREVERLQARD